MRQLRACDFCGDDAEGVYEPLPPEIADQRRVALCAVCRDTLEELLAPLEEVGGGTPAVTIDDGREAPDGPGGGNEGPGTEQPRSDPGDTTDADTRDGADTDTDAGGPDVSGAEPGDVGPSDGTSNADDGSGLAGEPDGFRTVMRLLNNRSFPLERTVAIELASGAYEFSDSEVEGILDYAVDRGVLEESGGKLHRG